MTAPQPEAAGGVAPVMARDPAALPGELPRGADIPADLDPLAEGVLMRHQAEWLADDADLKICEKGRRTGITFAEAFDSALTAMAARTAGGQNVFYIGDTKDKGREYIGYVAHFARVVARELAEIEEFLFKDEREDGTSRYISAYRVTFASGFRVEALSSRPENIRGLQGTVVIDEAAFHKDVRAVLDAVNALLIWGGRIRVISSHNGVLNPFNELIREAQAGKVPFSVHTVPFAAAVANGLYRRVCLMTGKTWSAEAEAAWEGRIRGAYGVRQAAMRQELDAIPADAEGAALTRVQIEAASRPAPVVRIHFDDDFKNLPADERRLRTARIIRDRIAPHLSTLAILERHVFGEDFARSGDLTAIVVMSIDQALVRRTRLVVEIRNGPFDQQREILFAIVGALPRFAGGGLDATGNGAYLAEVAAQKFGSTVQEIMLSAAWYQANMPAYIDAVADGTCLLAADEDIVTDHQALQFTGGGVIKVPDGHRNKGSDGFQRHGDTAIASAIAFTSSRIMQPPPLVETPSTVAASDDGAGIGAVFRTIGRRIWG